MAYHIKKPHILDSSKNLYYAGGSRWVEEYSSRKKFTTQTKARTASDNEDGTNGGFAGSTIVSE